MKIVTYNIHRGTNSSNKPTLNKMIKYLENIDCDIICLQEVLHYQFKKLKSDLNLEGVFAANVNKPPSLYGICILSKYKILNSTHNFLTSKKEQRGLLCVELEIGCDNTNIINTHLGLDKQERYDQISEILDFKNRLAGDIFLCGDFNEKNIGLSSLKDLAVIYGKDNIATLQKYNSRIDYIFTNRVLNNCSYQVDKINLSDHYPVVAKM